MKRWLEVALGIVTSVGGFLDIGSLATSAQAGAGYRYQLLWAIVLGTICLIFLVEMSGRLAIASHHTVASAIRERFGFGLFLFPLIATLLVSLLVLGCEIGGVALALQFATGVSYRIWALPVAFVAWLLLWKGNFGLVENGVTLLGLITLALVVGALWLHPDWSALSRGLLPSLPNHDAPHYWFTAVSILGASISPYLFLFYSSGAIEDDWDKSYFGVNRIIAIAGMSFGAVIAVGTLVIAAEVLAPRGIDNIEGYEQMAPMLVPAFGFWGFVLFLASLGIACMGASLEIGLQQAYLTAQGLGWKWGENVRPRDAPGFALVYTASLFLGALLMAAGIDPLQLTNMSMALTAASLPFGVVPFLLLMNDPRYVGDHGNGWIGNGAVVLIIGLAFVLAVVTIPLVLFGS